MKPRDSVIAAVEHREVRPVPFCFQTPCATALACREDDDVNYFVIPEIPFYIGHIARVPYLAPGSSELSEVLATPQAW